MHRLAKVLREIATEASAEPGDDPIPAGELAVVEDIAHHDDTSIGEIARRTGHAQSLVSKTVGYLRDAGVVSTTRDPADGRRLLVRLNPAARAGLLAVRGGRPVTAALTLRVPDLTAQQRSRLDRLLDEVAATLLR